MSSSNVRAKQIQQARRAILRILLDAYPRFLEGVSIFELLLYTDPDLVEEDVQRDLAYLMEGDKGYVETVGATKGNTWEQRCYKLTGKGNEVANRMESDPALGI